MIIHSPSALESIRQVAIKTLYSREERNQSNRLQILCCGGTGCKASESAKIVENFRTSLKAHNLDHQVDVVVTGCFGFCEKGPIVKIIPDNTFYTSVRPDDVEEIVSSHIIGGRKVERLLYLDPGRQWRTHQRLEAHELLSQADACRLAELRVHRSGKHHGVHCARRL